MSSLLPGPHGGKLIPLLASEDKKNEYLEEAKELDAIKVNSKECSDIVMLATGAFSPLEGFIGKEDYRNVLNDMVLKNGVLWPIPVTLSCSKEEANDIKEGQKISILNFETNEIMGIMTVQEKYEYDKNREAKAVFGTEDHKHPGVQKLFEQGDVYLAGDITGLSEGGFPGRFSEFARPAETREIFAQKGWETVVAFQTRNPIHRSHEYLTKVALEIFDGIFIHPIVGLLKEGDIPADVRLQCYKALLANYYPEDKVVLKVYPMEMRYAGPREAVLHAIIRQNFGCTHLIVGRDHAGVGDYYGPFDAQNIFDTLPKNSLTIRPLKMDWTFWCYKCSSMASLSTCPHDKSDHLMIAGTQLREMLSKGERAPEEFSRPEVLDILIDHYSKKNM